MSPRFFLFLFLSMSISAASQESNRRDTPRIIQLTNVPAEGIVLDKGWQYIIGDNPEFAKPAFDDRTWQSINPTLDVHDSLPQLSAGIVWFRLHVSPDSSVLKMQLSLVIQQSGASEIYLNGVKIASHGVVSSDAEKIDAQDPLWKPLPITFQPHDNVLAIRYALQPNILYTKIFETENPAFTIKIMRSEDAIDYYHGNASKIVGFEAALIGISLMIVILHLSFYIIYPSQKANLYFGMFAIANCIAGFTQLAFWLYPQGVEYKFYLGNLTFGLFILGHVFLMMAAYLFLQREKDFPFYFLIAFSGVALILNAWPYGFGWKTGGPVFNLLIQINIARIAIIATREKQRGAWIIAVGALNTLVFFTIFLLQGTFTNTSFVQSLPVFRILTYAMQNISLPTASSIFLAFEFAFINRAIQQKLREVSELSEKNLAHQKEKQQILEAQNETLEVQVQERTNALTQSLQELKATQSQLIQSEKMASLGELTAGIAHEIQNPLNFVNNFADINADLIDELQQELKAGRTEEAVAISKDIKENEEKINHHGKRADAIVKGMLQHSRSSTGVKEPMDINALCEEYLRLSYHGFRAKDKGQPIGNPVFNAKIETDFDTSVDKIKVVPQDIGRVILNLMNNAFYVVAEKKTGMLEQDVNGFEPTVSLTTKKIDGKVLISVRDNGNGIPPKVLDKIFQPFFTTKPTGKGTGLGLSLSYDIVKAHGGDIKVTTKEGEGSEFVISLPAG